MLIKDELIDKVTDIFGTRNELFYEYLWIARVGGMFKYEMLVSVVKKRSGEFRGLLLSTSHSPRWYREFGGVNPISYYEFTDRSDAVHDLFRSGIVLSENEGGWLDGEPYFLECYVASENMIATFTYNSDVYHDERRMNDKHKLREALIDTIRFLAKAYNHPEINEYLKPPDDHEPEG